MASEPAAARCFPARRNARSISCKWRRKRNNHNRHETPVVEDYGVPAPYKFTGKIDKVTIDLKETKTADHEEAEKSYKEYVLKKGLSD